LSWCNQAVQSTVNGHQDTATRTSSRELAADVMQGVQRLVSLEIALAKQELKEIAIRNLIAVACMAAAGLLAILAVFVAVPVLVVALVPWHWQAALVWAIAYGLVAVGLALYGKSRLSLRMPSRTMDSLKENKEWALHQLRSTKR
jgi:VIT1/CCC1 family predicted Fe2+/Mn2+ transporter